MYGRRRGGDWSWGSELREMLWGEGFVSSSREARVLVVF